MLTSKLIKGVLRIQFKLLFDGQVAFWEYVKGKKRGVRRPEEGSSHKGVNIGKSCLTFL